MMTWAIYFQDKPAPSDDWACEPVYVPHGDSTGHWEVLVNQETWDRINGSSETKSDIEKSKPKWLKKDKTPRHVFGPWGGERDPRKPLEPPEVSHENL
jgi:hypothetical protein